ncbi:hypothetical protein FJY68_09885 [candidate division WOR-3 bacterium]|uniref:Lycopene cyclase domain-containing protein n=1 Tax=candidate division WOR-3 bacterium TaxID=2052148 RepID=A0A937XFF9_UNCW3|nr:hypothetical protein [candidate division WOR-3 bacterium]
MNYTYACVVYALLFLVAWAIVFALARRARAAMVWTGVVFAPAALISELWHLQDYWLPNYVVPVRIGTWHFGGVEDLVFGFALAGISAGVFETLAMRQGLPSLPRMTWRAYLRMTGLGLVGLVLIAVTTTLVQLRSMHAATVSITLTAGLVLAFRPDLAPRALLTALAFAGFFWFFYAGVMLPLYPGMIDAFWMPHGNVGIRLAGVPLEEVVWGFSAALFSGPVLRACATPMAAGQGAPGMASTPTGCRTARLWLSGLGRRTTSANELDS